MNRVQTIQNTVNTNTHINRTPKQLSKHPHITKSTHTQTHTHILQNPHTHTQTHTLQNPHTHTHTHTLQNPHPHIHRPTHYKTHTHIHTHITKPTHTQTHTLQNPHTHTPAHYKTHTYTYPHKHTHALTHYKTHTYTYPHNIDIPSELVSVFQYERMLKSCSEVHYITVRCEMRLRCVNGVCVGLNDRITSLVPAFVLCVTAAARGVAAV